MLMYQRSHAYNPTNQSYTLFTFLMVPFIFHRTNMFLCSCNWGSCTFHSALFPVYFSKFLPNAHIYYFSIAQFTIELITLKFALMFQYNSTFLLLLDSCYYKEVKTSMYNQLFFFPSYFKLFPWDKFPGVGLLG